MKRWDGSYGSVRFGGRFVGRFNLNFNVQFSLNPTQSANTMTHNFSIRHGVSDEGNVFDIPGLGLTTLESWLGKTFMLPDSRVGECVSVRSETKVDYDASSPSVDLGLRVGDGSLIFASVGSLKQIRKSA